MHADPLRGRPGRRAAGATADVAEAVRRLSAASGLQFIDDGTTTERPSRGRDPYQPARYGASWAPILISWSSAQETDLLDDPRAEAVTVPIAVNSRSGSGGGSLVSAEVVRQHGATAAGRVRPGAERGRGAHARARARRRARPRGEHQ